MSTETFKRLRLRDGRWLGYAEYGETAGKPAFYFHGWPGSRLEAQLLDGPAKELGIRIIAIDRPGMGLSDYQPGRKIIDWPKDTCELADALHLDAWAVVGVSGGGPYAVACAAGIPERLTKVGIVSGMGPLDVTGATQDMIGYNRLLLLLGRKAPWMGRLLLAWARRRGQTHPERFLPPVLVRMFPVPDQVALQNPGLRRALTESMREAFRQGVEGPFYDGRLYAQPWDFRLDTITTEVFLWQGELDMHVPPAMGRYLAATLPRCHAVFFADEGHLSLPLNRLREILHVLAA